MKTRRSANQAAGGDDGEEERRRAGRAEIWEWWMNDFTSTGFIRTFARTTWVCGPYLSGSVGHVTMASSPDAQVSQHSDVVRPQ